MKAYRANCVACGAEAPPTDSAYTLISARFGWRIAQYEVHGRPHIDWRCPPCWRKYKATTAGDRSV